MGGGLERKTFFQSHSLWIISHQAREKVFVFWNMPLIHKWGRCEHHFQMPSNESWHYFDWKNIPHVRVAQHAFVREKIFSQNTDFQCAWLLSWCSKFTISSHPHHPPHTLHYHHSHHHQCDFYSSSESEYYILFFPLFFLPSFSSSYKERGSGKNDIKRLFIVLC